MCNQFRAYTREKPPYKDSWEHKMLSLRPYEEGVDMLLNGNLVCRFPHKLVNVFWSAFVTVTRLAEEHDKAEEIVYDNAIMKRSPFQLPFGLSDNKDIKKETLKEAQWNTKLRKYIPLPGIKSGEILGTPTLINDIDQLLKGGQVKEWLTYKISQMNKYTNRLYH